MLVDIDFMAPDAIENGLIFQEDARRDMASIDVPITWIHGRHDGWMDLDRVRELLSCGDIAKRCLLEVPAGHQLRTSREALETFQLVAREVGSHLLGRELQPVVPDLEMLELRRSAERERLPKSDANLRLFWQDYLKEQELYQIDTPPHRHHE